MYEKIRDYATLSQIYARSDRVTAVRKIFEFYFLTHKFDLDLALLIKNNLKKTFEYPFEVFFRDYFVNDPLILVLAYIVALTSKSTNMNELFIFHIFYINNKLSLMNKHEVNNTMDWQIQFLINSFVIVAIQSNSQEKAAAQVVHISRPMHRRSKEQQQEQTAEHDWKLHSRTVQRLQARGRRYLAAQ